MSHSISIYPNFNMPSIGSVFLFAAGAAAQLTTSMWLPGGSDYYQYSERYIDAYNASVVAKEGDKTVLALQPVIASATRGAYRASAATMTVHGTTSFEYITTQNSRVGYESTYSMGCSLAESTKVICAEATTGPNMYAEYCSYYTASQSLEVYTTTRRYTYSNPPQTVTQIFTSTESDYRQNYKTPSPCLSGSTLPESYYRTSYTARPETYQVVITAAAEKLTASSTSTPNSTNSTASTTSSGASGSGSTQNTGAPGTSGNNAPAPNQNAAAPMITLAPAMAGLGAAAAALFL